MPVRTGLTNTAAITDRSTRSMRMSAHRILRALPAAGLFLPLVALAGPCDFTATDAAVRAMLDARPFLPGAGVIVGDRDAILHQAYFGQYGPVTVVPVASASKLLSGVAIMTLVDDGLINPDAPVRDYLPQEFSFANAGLKSVMTTRQMFAHTSGLPGEDATSDILGDPTLTLEEAVAQIACCVPLHDLPGASFSYGGLSMHVGGRIAEVVSGGDWEDFFQAAVSTPLGLTTIDYQGLGPTTNYRIAGGARSNLPDYARVLAMLLRGGEIDGVRLLSEQSASDMVQDQTEGLPRRTPPPSGAEDWGYAFGGWVSAKGIDGRTTEFTSPGAFGFTPWIDLERGIYAAIMVDASRALLADELDAIKLAIQADADRCACPADLAPPAGTLNFFDLAAYLTLFNSQDPTADLALPIGVFNFFDLASYLTNYNAGCP
jgi:CubicO group peptidase (beta-lactamase class C family)